MSPCEASGVLTVNKPAGMTSHDAVNIVRRLYGTKQVGHTGTLDPMATGVLPVLVGRAVKASEYLLSERKTYEALLRLGVRTDTGDTTGRVLERSDALPGAEKVLEVCASFVGKIEQIPPMYSALKVGGKKLVDLARKGVEVERAPRQIEIFSLDAETENEKEGLYRLTVVCSGGTYIRTLCEDIGKALSCGDAMAALTRSACGPFYLKNAHAPEELERMTQEERLKLLLPVEELFSELPRLDLQPFFEKLIASGCSVDEKKLGASFPEGTRLRLYGARGFFALGEVRPANGAPAVKAVKHFLT